MIQDIFPHKLYNQFNPEARPQPEDIVLCVENGKILVEEAAFKGEELVFPRVKAFAADTKYIYLFKVDEIQYFMPEKKLAEEEHPEGYIFTSDKSLRTEHMGPMENIFAAITAKHLSDWYRDTKFCGRCGKLMSYSELERAKACECGYTAYPRIMPAVIVGVTNGDKLLITRYNRGFAHNALIAGFTEIGETVEETVAREVMEEAGVRVKNIRYYKSQPWGSANDILLGFYCDVDGDDTITMDNSELKFAKWLGREEIELQPGSFSLTNEMMKKFKLGESV